MLVPGQKLNIIGISLKFWIFFSAFHVMTFKRFSIITVSLT